MAEFETEDQQLEALRKWWQENGRGVLVGVVLGLGAVGGWRGWVYYTEARAESGLRCRTQLLVAEKCYVVLDECRPDLIDHGVVEVNQGSAEITTPEEGDIGGFVFELRVEENDVSTDVSDPGTVPLPDGPLVPPDELWTIVDSHDIVFCPRTACSFVRRCREINSNTIGLVDLSPIDVSPTTGFTLTDGGRDATSKPGI